MLFLAFGDALDYSHIAKFMYKGRCQGVNASENTIGCSNYYDSRYGYESIDVRTGNSSVSSVFDDTVMIYVRVQEAKNDIPLEELVQKKYFADYMLKKEDRAAMAELDSVIKNPSVKNNNEQSSELELNKYLQLKKDAVELSCKKIRINYPHTVFYKVKYEDPEDMKALAYQYLTRLLPGRKWTYDCCQGGSYSLVAPNLITVIPNTCPKISFLWYRTENGICIGKPVHIGIDPRDGSLVQVLFLRDSVEGKWNKGLEAKLSKDQILRKGRKKYYDKMKKRVRYGLWEYFGNEEELDLYMTRNWDRILKNEIIPSCKEKVILKYCFKGRNRSCFLGYLTEDEVNERAKSMAWNQLGESQSTWNRELLRYDYIIIEEDPMERVDEVYSFDALTGELFYDGGNIASKINGSKYTYERFGDYSYEEVGSDNFRALPHIPLKKVIPLPKKLGLKKKMRKRESENESGTYIIK